MSPNTAPLSIGSLCTGYGGLDMGLAQVWNTALAWYGDSDPAAGRVMAHHHPELDNVGDLTQLDWARVPRVDVVTAGYPCQPFSIAGKKEGTNDARHLWPYIRDGIRLLRPGLVVLENVPHHVRLGLADVLGDLASLGYDAAWGVFRASEAGAPHRRERVFIVAADPAHLGHQRSGQAWDGWPGLADGGRAVANSYRKPRLERRTPAPGEAEGGRSHGEPGGRLCVPSDSDRSGLAFGASIPGDARTELAPAQRGRDEAVPDSTSHGWVQGRSESTGLGGGSNAACGGPGAIDWQHYTKAVRRWERCLARPAPNPSAIGPRGGKKVNPAFAEWMMGLPAGWVSDVPGVSMNEALKLCGNGVVPAQAALAVHSLERAVDGE